MPTESAVDQLIRGLGIVEDAINRLASEDGLAATDLTPLRWAAADVEDAIERLPAIR